MWWIGSDNEKLAKQTQASVVLVLGEKIFRTPDQRLMLDCLKETRGSVSDMQLLEVPHLDDIDVKSDLVLANGWHCQPYVDLMALETFGWALEYAESGLSAIPVKTRTNIATYIKNQSKASTRIKMMLRGVTKVGAHGCNSKKIADVISLVEKLIQSASKLGDEYVVTAEALEAKVNDMLANPATTGSARWSDIYDALVDVLEVCTEGIQELASACQGLLGPQSDAFGRDRIVGAGGSIGKTMMLMTEGLLEGINAERRIIYD